MKKLKRHPRGWFFSKRGVVPELNKKYAAIMVRGKFFIMMENRKPGGDIELDFASLADMRAAYANRPLKVKKNGKTTEINPISYWLKSPERREYKGIVFAPGREVPGFYNLFNGLSVEPHKGDVDVFLQHARNVVCAGSDDLFEFVMDWLADLVQNIGGPRPGTALVLRGVQGSGKGLFVRPLGRIFGNHFKHIYNESHFLGRFNEHIANALLIFADESFFAGNKAAAGRLKGIITERHISIEGKFRNAYFLENHARVIIASNSQWVVPADLDERRMLVLDVNPDRKGDFRYMHKLARWADGEGPGALLHYLQQRKITRNLREIPRTKALLDQILESMNSVEKYWVDALFEGQLAGEGWPDVIFTSTLWGAYTVFCQKTKIAHPVANNRFTRILRKFCPAIMVSSGRDGPSVRRILRVPPLEVAREIFTDRIGIKITW